MKDEKGRRAKKEESALKAQGTPSSSILHPSSFSKRDALILAAILLVGLAFRAFYLAEIMREPDFRYPALDPQFNDYWARAMITGNWTPPPGYPDPEIRTTPHGRPPGYPYTLALIYLLSGSSYLAPRLVQMTLGLINGLLMFFLGRAVFGRKVGFIAAAFMVTYWAFIHFEGELTYPAVAVFVSLLLMYVLRFWARKPTFVRALTAGVLLGIFALFRPNVVLFGPVLVAWFWWVLGGRKCLRPFLISSAAATLGTLIAIAPPLVRNYVVADDFVFLSSYGGVNLWAGNNENADCVTPKIPDLKKIAGFEDWTCFHYPTIVRGVARQLDKDHIKFSEASDYFYQQARAFIIHHPIKTLILAGKKTLIFWGPIETTNDKVLHYAKKNSKVLHYLPGFPAVLALLVTGSVLFFQDWRRTRLLAGSAARQESRPPARELGAARQESRPPTQEPEDSSSRSVSLLLFIFIFAYFASVIPYFVAGRYRVPVIPFVLLFAAYGVCRAAEWVTQRDYRRAGVYTAAAVGVYIVGSIPFVSYKPDLAIWHHQRAKAYEQQGDFDKAIAEVREELRINPNYPEGRNFLGLLLVKQGRIDDGIAAYQDALRLDPANDVAWNNLGYELGNRGNAAEAERCYREALRINPQLGLAHNNLGNLLLEQGQAQNAAREFEQALQIDPSDKYADYNLGNALRALGRPEEAIRHYARARELDPANPDIPNNLGLAYADLGKADEAIRAYHEAIQLDPEYANAYNNLGYELAKERKYDEAIQQYNEALRLNPKFGLALNNLGKLLADQGKTDEAAAQFARALEANPKDKTAHLNLGDLYMDQGRIDDAIAQYEQALANDPANADIPNNLANALVRKTRLDDAIRYYAQAIRINPRHVAAYCNLGTVLAAQGRLDEAIQHFRKALEIDPNHSQARDGLNRALDQKKQRGS